MSDVKPKVGDYVKIDNWPVGEHLQTDDGFSDDGFPGCQFRLPSGLGRFLLLAVNVKVTGKKCHKFGQYCGEWVRCRVEFVGDCEPSTFCGGWLLSA